MHQSLMREATTSRVLDKYITEVHAVVLLLFEVSVFLVRTIDVSKVKGVLPIFLVELRPDLFLCFASRNWGKLDVDGHVCANSR